MKPLRNGNDVYSRPDGLFDNFALIFRQLQQMRVEMVKSDLHYRIAISDGRLLHEFFVFFCDAIKFELLKIMRKIC